MKKILKIILGGIIGGLLACIPPLALIALAIILLREGEKDGEKA